ncbi:hypothetical protein ABT001_30370 [Streptomyces sp. NPDC002793]
MRHHLVGVVVTTTDATTADVCRRQGELGDPPPTVGPVQTEL